MERQIPTDKMEKMINFLNDHKTEYGRTSGQAQLIDEYEIYTPIHEFLKYGLENALNCRNIYQSYHNEILSWFDVFDREEDPYAIFADTIEKRFGSLKGKTIIEIGCGPVPALSRKLADKMRGENGELIGSLTAYDPDIVIRQDELPEVKLVKSLFEKDTQLPQDVLLVAMTPVTEAVHIVEFKVNKEKISSIIQLGVEEDLEYRLSLNRENPYGVMTLSHEPSKYSGNDERIISYESGRSK